VLVKWKNYILCIKIKTQSKKILTITKISKKFQKNKNFKKKSPPKKKKFWKK